MANLGGVSGGGEPLLGGGGEPLLGGDGEDVVVEGMLDYKGTKAVRLNTGRWRSAGFMIGVEICERFGYYGVSSNLINYLTGPLQQSTAVAAINVNTWSGAVAMLPLLGAIVADSYLGKYRTILFASLLYTGGLGLLTLAALLPSISPDLCQDIENNHPCSPPQLQVILFFTSLYIVAIAQGGHKPCTQAFGADQFNNQDPQESKSRGSFFNWSFFGLCWGTIFAYSILTYIQDNISWALGYGCSCIAIGIALIIFLLGTKTYRYSVKDDTQNPFIRIWLVFFAAAKNWRFTLSPFDTEEKAAEGSHQFKFLDKALIDASDNQDDSKRDQAVCSVSQVNDAKTILRLVPIWSTCLMYGMVLAQATTFYIKQGNTMERSLGPSFQIPPASLLTFTSLSIISFIPVYDFVIVPIARAFTHKPSGITMLQRIGFGLILSTMTMVVAALVEQKRLKTASDFGLINIPGAIVPMAIWWLLPQYCLSGVADVFVMVGLQEFFYDQVPKGLESLGIALYWSIFGVGSLLSGFLIIVVEKVTSAGGYWLPNNLNQGHLDYFYWLVAGLSAVGFVTYLYFARSYVYNRQK